MLYLSQQKLGLTLVKNDLRGAVSAIIKTPEEIEKMRVAGKLAADVLTMITPYVKKRRDD